VGNSEFLGDGEGAVGGGAIGDEDRPSVWEVGLEVVAKGGDAARHNVLLIVDRDDDLDADLSVRRRVVPPECRSFNSEVFKPRTPAFLR
jgi:hypothetical protein